MIITKADQIVELLEMKKELPLGKIASLLSSNKDLILAYCRYLEDSGVVKIDYNPQVIVKFLKNPDVHLEFRDEKLVLNRIRILLELNDLKELKRLLYDLYTVAKNTQKPQLEKAYRTAHNYLSKYFTDVKWTKSQKKGKESEELIKELEEYKIGLDKFAMRVRIVKQEFEAVPYYNLSVIEYGSATRVVFDRVREEVIKSITLDSMKEKQYEEEKIRAEFQKRLQEKLSKLVPDMPDASLTALVEYITITALGMGDIEILLHDPQIEEIVINCAEEPVMLYHDKYKWVKTNIIIDDEEVIKHYATLAGRLVNKNVTLLAPLLDAHLISGDRVNATLEPISTKGNTLTIRKFASKPWTISRLIKTKTIDYDIAALIWLCIQYELSVLIVGGTGSGKTSTLNVIANFFQPNQRIVSIEDTRELTLPDSLHWVPLQSRLPNPEGKGEVSMLDLVVNSLRMRPDRIIVGEIRRKAEAEVMFEAMHTGHSVYATLHANSVSEAVLRLTNPPIDLPKNVLNSLALILVQNRNRRTGERRTFQVAEILENGEYSLLYEHDIEKDVMEKINAPKRLYETLRLFSGMSKAKIDEEIKEKVKILKYIVDEEIDEVNRIGYIISDYYTNKDYLFAKIDSETKTKNSKKK